MTPFCLQNFRNIWYLFSTCTTVTVAFLASSAAVDAFNPPEAYSITAELHGIPDGSLLYAIAQQESGRFYDGADRIVPWPWTINIEGKAYYYRNMAEAKESLVRYIRLRPKHIGIGLLQITWPYNQHLPWRPIMALDPQINLSLGAIILRECYNRLGDWWAAVGCYHSPTPMHAERYRRRVKRRWQALNDDEDAR
jgi:hypothetical protein